MTRQLRFHLTAPDNNVSELIKRRGHTVVGAFQDKFDGLVIPGGADISTSLYGDEKLGQTWSNFKNDAPEIFKIRAMPKRFPKIGICRGAQMLNAINGGKMWQHVDNHGRAHEMQLGTGEIIMTTSVHHQMMIPGPNVAMLATSREADKKHKYGVYERSVATKPGRDFDEPEMMYYPQTNSYCVQGHPEYCLGGEAAFVPFVLEFWKHVETLCFPIQQRDAI